MATGVEETERVTTLPAMAARLAEYRDLGYVVAQVTQLAAQLARLAV